MIRLLLLILIGMTACSTPETEMSYSEDQMATLVTDIHVAKAAIQNAPPHVRDSLYEVYFLQICEIHGVDPDSLQQDLDALTSNPDRLEPIYARVVDSLEHISLKNRDQD